MKKEYFLLIATTAITVILVLGMVRFIAPSLLGGSRDLVFVRSSVEIPPFFDNIFREEDYTSDEFILHDPRLIIRGRPLYPGDDRYGPNDILGFRNWSVPNHAEIVTIGDSQTYGNNAPLELNWPSRMGFHLGLEPDQVYNMSVGGWNAPQYLEIFPKALIFKPKVIIVAFYTGNDAFGSFLHVYGSENWPQLKTDTSLTAEDAPNVPAAFTDKWSTTFGDGTKIRFTPKRRLLSNNLDLAPVRAGSEILRKVATNINRRSKELDIPVIFTIIPTKELVYANRIIQDGIDPPKDYKNLIEQESINIKELAEHILSLGGSEYVDVVTPLQVSALTKLLYPKGTSGHPTASGYEVIGATLAKATKKYISETF